MRCQLQHIEPSIPNQAIIGGCGDRYAIVKEWRVLDCIALEALGSEF